jgi:hypothetical protein
MDRAIVARNGYGSDAQRLRPCPHCEDGLTWAVGIDVVCDSCYVTERDPAAEGVSMAAMQTRQRETRQSHRERRVNADTLYGGYVEAYYGEGEYCINDSDEILDDEAFIVPRAETSARRYDALGD